MGPTPPAPSNLQNIELAIMALVAATLGPNVSAVQSFANSGSAGGTGWYVTIGKLKLAWGISGSIATATTGSAKSVVFPSSFFASVNTALVAIATLGGTAAQYAGGNSFSASSMDFFIQTLSGTGSATAGWIAIGS